MKTSDHKDFIAKYYGSVKAGQADEFLTERQKECFLLRFKEDGSVDSSLNEIAETMEISISSVGSFVQMALRSLLQKKSQLTPVLPAPGRSTITNNLAKAGVLVPRTEVAGPLEKPSIDYGVPCYASKGSLATATVFKKPEPVETPKIPILSKDTNLPMTQSEIDAKLEDLQREFKPMAGEPKAPGGILAVNLKSQKAGSLDFSVAPPEHRDDEFSTVDIACAAVLIIQGFRVSEMLVNGTARKCGLTFRNQPGVGKAAREYFDRNCKVDALTLMEVRNKIKQRCYEESRDGVSKRIVNDG